MEYLKSNVPCGRALVVNVCILHARASIVEIRLEACDRLHFGGINSSKMTDQLQTDLKQNTFDSNAGVMCIFSKITYLQQRRIRNLKVAILREAI